MKIFLFINVVRFTFFKKYFSPTNTFTNGLRQKLEFFSDRGIFVLKNCNKDNDKCPSFPVPK